MGRGWEGRGIKAKRAAPWGRVLCGGARYGMGARRWGVGTQALWEEGAGAGKATQQHPGGRTAALPLGPARTGPTPPNARPPPAGPMSRSTSPRLSKAVSFCHTARPPPPLAPQTPTHPHPHPRPPAAAHLHSTRASVSSQPTSHTVPQVPDWHTCTLPSHAEPLRPPTSRTAPTLPVPVWWWWCASWA